MKEEEKIKEEIKNWIEDNRDELPLNVDSWNIQVFKNDKGIESAKPVKLGKYNAEILFSDPFYKPYSKTFIL
ncbi:hypothetical protein [Chryseobacterium herbae]|uniref:Uncharacterized protein n=1 Tax=Chryseobacterium herbae TaxID=2976476 RepID=A0ABT2IXU0_9FLAO|nr:hypothetical protein [Chryseobacterium sp. pc1-10]MCT2563655.1 hypothetical protein [Chryseobacterium sp. pc1-10]